MRFHVLLIPLLLTILGVSSPCYAGAGAQNISDFVIAFDDITNESTIYVTDAASRAIYKIDGARGNLRAPKESSLADLQPFFQMPNGSSPTGIAYYNGKLLVSDPNFDAVFEIDTTTKILSVLLKGGAVTAPTQLAVSQSGRVAVTNAAGELNVYERLTRTFSPKRRIENIAKITFVGDDLLVLKTTGKIS